MRRLGTILMILGVNIAVAAVAAAFWRASFNCVTEGADGVMLFFISLLFSGEGLIYWGAIIAGIWVFWRGRRLRADQ